MSLAVGTTDVALLLLVVLLLLLLVDDDRWKLARARRSAAPGPVGCGGGGKEEDEEDDDAAEKDDAAEEAEEDEEEEPSLAASALSMASDNTWCASCLGGPPSPPNHWKVGEAAVSTYFRRLKTQFYMGISRFLLGKRPVFFLVGFQNRHHHRHHPRSVPQENCLFQLSCSRS